MPFLPRNRYYLRVSSSSILPLYVYLDSQHVDWMSDRVLRQVVADLRPKIVAKLRAETDAHLGSGPAPANAKKGTVDVHRGDTYQFAYFLRESEPYSVLIKTRNFVLDAGPPAPHQTSSGPAEQRPGAGKRKGSSSRRKGKSTGASQVKSRKTRQRKETGGNGEDEEDYHTGDSEPFGGDVLSEDEDEEFEMSEISNKGTAKGTPDVTDKTTRVDVKVEEDEHSLPQTKPPSLTVESSHVEDTGGPIEVDDDDEPKPKLALELKYRAFSNFNRCLCVVVEPWPPQRSASRAPSLAPSAATTRVSTVTPTASEFSANRGQRAKTPLFLPDVDDEPATPGSTSSHSHFHTLPPVPLFDDPPTTHGTDDAEEWDDNTSLMQFSQMLNTTGVGGIDVEEEDEFDGTALFADADETREL